MKENLTEDSLIDREAYLRQLSELRESQEAFAQAIQAIRDEYRRNVYAHIDRECEEYMTVHGPTEITEGQSLPVRVLNNGVEVANALFDFKPQHGSRRGRNIKTDESRKARYSQSRK